MAVLEYLTQNSLTAYPFKRLSAEESNNIQANWFYDILFVSYSSEILSVYISEIEKTNSKLVIVFNNFLNDEEILRAEIPSTDVVNHFSNFSKSFYGASNSIASVKIILGEGLASKENFYKNYEKEETELAAGAIVLNIPKLKTLTLKTYNSDFDTVTNNTEYDVVTVKQYNKDSDYPEINLRYNFSGELSNVNNFNLDVTPGAGAGLYDNCPTESDMSIYSVANVVPNEYGSLFIKATSCYAYNVLNDTNGALLQGLNPSPENVYEYSLENPQHAIYFQNFCSPKCPRENITSFAHYLNRVTDGAKELVTSIYNTEETRGYGQPSLVDRTIFTASSFTDNTFTRCSTHDSFGVDTFIGINNKFIKNFHEFKTLELFVPGVGVLEYLILEVISTTQVRLNLTVSSLGPSLQFRIRDNGVFSNMNCATKLYNLKAAALTVPYIKVNYSSYESTDPAGLPITYITVNTAVFNPSSSTYNLTLALSYINLSTDGMYKIIRGSNIAKTTIPQVTLACREYVFMETVFYTYSSTDMGSISAQLINSNTGAPIGSSYEVVSNAQANPGITYILSAIKNFRALQNSLITFVNSLSIASSVTALAVSGDIPPWLDYNYSLLENSFDMTANPSVIGAQANTRYKLKLTATAEGVYSNRMETITIDYLAVPKISSPLAAIFTSQTPKVVSKATTYTSQAPLIAISAVNMNSWVEQFPTDATTFNYTATGTVPAGLQFNTASGKLTGTVTDLNVGDTFTLAFKATNPAGESSTETINFIIAA